MASAIPVVGRRRIDSRVATEPLPPLRPALGVIRSALIIVSILSATLIAELVVVGGVEQRSAQQTKFDRLRGELAEGVAPTGPIDESRRALRGGTPMAYIEIPSIQLRQVVSEGTSAGTLFAGPGHRRDSPFPGQAGTSVILGRRTAFGGPFARLRELRPGASVRVTTGAGVFDYRVSGVRHDHDPAPAALAAGEARLLLATADGGAFAPLGVLRVDATQKTAAVVGAPPAFSSTTLPLSERMMQPDLATLWALVLWLQALLVIAIGGVWAWHRWHRAKAWVVFLPLLLLVVTLTSGQALRLLPNLL